MYFKTLYCWLLVLLSACNTSSYSIVLAQERCHHLVNRKEYTTCVKTEFPKTQNSKAKYSSDRVLCNYQAQREIDEISPRLSSCINNGELTFTNKSENCEQLIVIHKHNPADYRHLLAQLKVKCMKEKGWQNESIWFY